MINADRVPELRERFGLTLSNAVGATIKAGEAVGTILDDDHHLFFTSQALGSRVEIRNATTGEVLTSFNAFSPGFKGGVRIASADVNGDGFDDVITGTGNGGEARVRVWDGHNTSHGKPVLLYDFLPYGHGYRGGVYIAAGDVDSDGQADIIVAPSSGSSGAVKVYSGANGSLHSRITVFPRGAGGVRVAAGDINGDGFADIIAGSGSRSRVLVFDGRDSTTVLSSFNAFEASYRGGVSVAGGDVNGDGLDDVIVGAGRGSSLVHVLYSGSRQRMVEFEAFPNSSGGINVAAADLNADGIADIIATHAGDSRPVIRVFKGTSALDARPTRVLPDLTAFAFDPGYAGGVFVG